MKREQLLYQLQAVTHSVTDLFELTPIHQLDFRPAPHMRSMLELGNHFAAVPLVDLAILQSNPGQVTETIEDTLHGAGPVDWVEIFARGSRAVAEFFERMSEEEFETSVTRAHYGTAKEQSVWLLEMIGHIYHHRGQFYAYLLMLNVSVDVEHLYTQ
jgi:uncharacterized damage-inducible protein DinB